MTISLFRRALRLARPLTLAAGVAAGVTAAMALPAAAACVGQNLFDALPAAQQTAITSAAHAVPYAQGLMFRAEKAGQSVTLIGTYHLADDRHAGLLDSLAPAMDKASALLVEAGPEEERQLKDAMARDASLAFITDGPTLPERLNEADWQRLRSAASARGIPGPMAAKMKPWFVTVSLALSPCALREARSGVEGLDRQVMDMATAKDVPIAALEPYDTAFGIFAGLSEDDENDMIVTALSAEARADDYMQTLSDAYFRREPRLIWEFSREDAKANSGLTAAEVDHQMDMTEDLLMTRRNRAWLPVIDAAAAKGPVVVAVGALHLGGQTGVLRLMEDDGWTITRLDG